MNDIATAQMNMIYEGMKTMNAGELTEMAQLAEQRIETGKDAEIAAIILKVARMRLKNLKGWGKA